jgi:hypothetical protein
MGEYMDQDPLMKPLVPPSTLLLCNFFKHRFSQAKLRVFLCGRAPGIPHFDLRIQLKRLMSIRMGCKSFLGEDIEAIKDSISADRNHLTIEVDEAKQSDLIVIFLESPGAISELTAFALDRDINPKTVVFNDAKYRNTKSFISLGPLQLLPKDNIVYYTQSSGNHFLGIVSQLDRVVARAWFARSRMLESKVAPSFESFIAAALIYVYTPISYRELAEAFPWDEKVLTGALKYLIGSGYFDTQHKLYVPKVSIDHAAILGDAANDVARCRARQMANRLKDPKVIANYERIIWA